MNRKRRPLTTLLGVVLIAWGIPPLFAAAAAAEEPGRDLAEMPIEDLMNVKVSSMARKAQSLSETAGAVFVITDDDIRRTGATTLAEALRLAPGLEVARISGDSWAITARGFNGRSANKLLVLLDGRVIYEPLFSGVLWEAQDVVLEDIDRIEIIRGPGASVWGANAVNGVINILTKSAHKTEGGLVSAYGGNETHGTASVRYGARRDSGTSWRVYGKGFNRDAFLTPAGVDGTDDWKAARTGFQIDGTFHGGSLFTLQGDTYVGRNGETLKETSLTPASTFTVDDVAHLGGSNLLGRWTRSGAPNSQQVLQFYFDSYQRVDDTLGERRQNFDIDFHHNLPLGSRQDLVYGTGLRLSHDRLDNSFTLSFNPDHRNDLLASAFVEDLVRFAGGRVHLTFGTKLEHNDFTGFEMQPTTRAVWNLSDSQMAWAAISRAVRTPSQVEENIRYNSMAFPTLGPDVLVSVFGNRDQLSEELTAYEAGFRAQHGERASVDVATFYNRYHHLSTTEVGATVPEGSHLLTPAVLDNQANATAYGAEVSGTWHVLERWRLASWYSLYRLDIQPFDSSVASDSAEGDSPRHQFLVRSSLDLPRGFSIDAVLHWVAELPHQDVPAYVRADLRFAWRPRPGLELSLNGQNLLDRSHQEFGSVSDLALHGLVERTFDVRVVWRFPRSGQRP